MIVKALFSAKNDDHKKSVAISEGFLLVRVALVVVDSGTRQQQHSRQLGGTGYYFALFKSMIQYDAMMDAMASHSCMMWSDQALKSERAKRCTSLSSFKV